MQKQYVTNVDFFSKFERGFDPAILQEHLHKDVNNMRELNCEDLPDYVCRFRHVVIQVREKSELDQVMYFFVD